MKVKILIVLVLLLVGATVSFAQTTEFTYQGKITDTAGTAASYDFEFRLFDVNTSGTALGTNQRLGVPVTGGVFTVRLNFGATPNFTGSERWLEIAVKPAGSANPLTVLSPRQSVASVPYSIRSLNAAAAEQAANSAQLGGVNASQFVQTIDTRLSDARNPLPNSANYIQNTTLPQTASNFNIAGDGTTGGTLSGNAVNSVTQYNIGGSRVLTTSGFFGNFFAGIGAGGSPTSIGQLNSFFGNQAGQSNVTGRANSFFGKSAGNSNTDGGNNSFFGEQSGFGTSTGNFNSFFGQFSGRNNQTGSDNAFFGYRAGANNTASGNSFFGSGTGDSVTSGANNAFFGRNAGAAVITGSGNSFFGYNAGLVSTVGDNSFFGAFAGDSNTTGLRNSFFGNSAGSANVTAINNSFFGYHAGSVNTASDNSFFGSDTGNRNTTGANNSFFGSRAGGLNTSGFSNSFFGSLAGYFTDIGDDNAFFGTGAGYNNRVSFNSFFGSHAGEFNLLGSANSFFGHRAGYTNGDGDSNVFVGEGAGYFNTEGNENVFVGALAGELTTNGDFNTFAGRKAGNTNTTGGNNTVLGSFADVSSGSLQFATAIGARSRVTDSDTIVIGKSPGFYGGISRPADTVLIQGDLAVNVLGSGGTTDLCRNASRQISTCSSSLRYKTNVQTFSGGINVVRRLRPITFNWRDGGMSDVGFAAEEVNEIEPLLTTRNDKGEIEGVKYAQITTVLVNAVNEQQTNIEAQQTQNNQLQAQVQKLNLQIEQQQKQIVEQQQAIDDLRKLVCRQSPTAEICKERKK